MNILIFLSGCLFSIAVLLLKRKHNKEIVISAKHWKETVPIPNLDQEIYDIYLAGPMRGKKGGNKDLFITVGENFEKMGYSVWNPALQNDSDMTFSHCMKNDLMAIILECKQMVLLPGWKKSLGANAEVLTGYLCGKSISELTLDEDDNIIGSSELEIELVLPFLPEHKEFRSKKEMSVPEKDVFENTPNGSNEK